MPKQTEITNTQIGEAKYIFWCEIQINARGSKFPKTKRQNNTNEMWKICIFTLVIALLAVAAATTPTTEPITNDLVTNNSSSHAPFEETTTSTRPMAENNQTLVKISTPGAESREISAVGGSTSTATPTTTATTSTTTTLATTSVVAENEETTTSTISHLMTTSEPNRKIPIAGLGELSSGIKDALHRIKLSESPKESAAKTTTMEPPEAEEQDESEDVPLTVSPLQIQMQAAASYQVAETLADLNEEERARYDAMLAQQPTASKLNIVDLYPLKIEDIQPMIQNDNEELIKQRTIFTQPENSEDYKQNLLPNEVELVLNGPDSLDQDTIKINQEKAATTPETLKMATISVDQGTTPDFTGKLLADQDDLITEIESKFQMEDTTTTTTRKPLPLLLRPGDTFIDRRVKKSFEFPTQHRASDVMAMPHIDFANTKFQTDADQPQPAATHPEFSTTKFYNSKELYNEMLLHNKRKLMKETSPEKSATEASSTKLNVTPEAKTFQPTTTAATTVKSKTLQSATTTTAAASPAAAAITTSTIKPTTTATGKYQKELKRAKLLLKALTPPQATKSSEDKLSVKATKAAEGGDGTGAASTISIAPARTSTPVLMATARTVRPAGSVGVNPTKTASKPIARPRILSRLQEKINSLECEVPSVPQDSHLWRGNETHELLLPIVVSTLEEIINKSVK